MNKICTSLEQSKKLVELGIDIKTADFIWKYDSDKKVYYYKVTITPYIFFNDIPAWSLSALLGLMPFHIIENDVRYGFQMVKGLNKEGETYKIRYEGYISLVETLIYNNPIDAAFELVCWLKENGKI